MTFGELERICKQKIFEDNPQKLKRSEDCSEEEWVNRVVAEYTSITDSKTLLTQEISNIFLCLQKELGIPMEEVHRLSSDTEVPPLTVVLVERLRRLSFAEPTVTQ